jgi:hypothetical protein
MIMHKSQADVLRVRIVRDAIVAEIEDYLRASDQSARQPAAPRPVAAHGAADLVAAAMAWAHRGAPELAATA